MLGWTVRKSIGWAKIKGKVVREGGGIRCSGCCTHCVVGWRFVRGRGGSLVLAVIGGRRTAVVVRCQGETEDRDANAGTRCTELFDVST